MNLNRLLITALLTSSAFAVSVPAVADELADGFKDPPSSARPRVWWHWMNGNVTIDGIEKDLAWMKRVGIGGLQNFDASLATPQVVEKRLVFMDPDWKAAFKHAVQSAEAKGLEFAIAASPGWSETGGPWVKPDDGMKKLVWSQTVIPGGKAFKGQIAAPPRVTGPFQDHKLWDPVASFTGSAVFAPPQAGGEIATFAVSAQPALSVLPKVSLGDGSAVDAAMLFDAADETAIKVKTGTADTPASLTFDYGKPITVRSARLHVVHAKPPFGEPGYLPLLEVEQNGIWRKLGTLGLSEVSASLGFPAVTAQRFRLVLAANPAPARVGLGEGAPGAETFDIATMLKVSALDIGNFRLSGDVRLSQSEVKAGFGTVNDYYEITGKGAAKSGTKVVDLSKMVKPDGTLDWTPPKGSDWRIYRFGWSLTGKVNHPATKEATGLEVDKYDPAAVRRYLEHYLGLYRDVVGKELMGAKGIRALLTDSIEVGPSNWTANLPAEFKARRGYDMMPWFPTLAGEVIGSEAETEKFLYDFRATLADMLADNHYGTVAKVAHEHGLKVYGEALEDVRPVLGNDIAMRKYADVPMAALWTWNRGSPPRPTLLGDMKGAASVAHIYGQNIVAAESMTSASQPWAFAPRDLKRVIDLEFASGINRPVVHTSVHQPLDDKQPGLSLMIFGQYFNRHDTWAEMAKPWVTYMARTCYMLQQGRNHADIAYFYGEEMPLTTMFAQGAPKDLPKRYAYDFVNADVLANALSFEGGEIVAKGGARYKALYLGGTSHKMTLATLKRVAAMVEAGATVIGEKPEGSPALKDDADAFKSLADKLWANPRVIATRDVEAGMAKAGVKPDFSHDGAGEILFVHRKLADGEAYFVNNRDNKAHKIEARFRVTGKTPEYWDAISGTSSPLTYRIIGDETIIPLNLAPEDAKFVIFRQAGEGSATAATAPMLKSQSLNANWKIAFQPGRGAPVSATMSSLAPLNESSDPGIKHFSGIATYTTTFTLPKGAKAGAPLWLDLGEVGDLAEVRVNGQSVGTVWFAPFRVDIGKLMKIGSNTLEVSVANTWVNRLIGDKQRGAQKITFTAAPTYKPDAPLRASGLIGPVTLISQ